MCFCSLTRHTLLQLPAGAAYKCGSGSVWHASDWMVSTFVSLPRLWDRLPFLALASRPDSPAWCHRAGLQLGPFQDGLGCFLAYRQEVPFDRVILLKWTLWGLVKVKHRALNFCHPFCMKVKSKDTVWLKFGCSQFSSSDSVKCQFLPHLTPQFRPLDPGFSLRLTR